MDKVKDFLNMVSNIGKPDSKAQEVAYYFIYKNNQDKKGLTNKKLQKLLYYAQAWSLVTRNKVIFHEDIEAWVHGPAIPRIYIQFKDYGSSEIIKEIEETSFSDLNIDEKKLLDEIWRIYGKYDGSYLETLSHSEEPWQEARKGLSDFESSNNKISTDTMKKYYGQKIKRSE